MDKRWMQMLGKKISTGAAIAVLGLGAGSLQAQIASMGVQEHSSIKPDVVTYLFPEQVTLSAGKAAEVALHFRIADGMHINSHIPSGDSLIPAVFTIPDGEGAQLVNAAYPAGETISLAADPGTTLSVYTGEFVIRARIVAAEGDHLVEGRLRYQACNQRQCLPPKTIAVPIDMIGKR